jgi:hypothetical protein
LWAAYAAQGRGNFQLDLADERGEAPVRCFAIPEQKARHRGPFHELLTGLLHLLHLTNYLSQIASKLDSINYQLEHAK